MISDEATAETYSRVGRSLPLTLPERLGKVPCAMRRRRGKGAILDAYFSVPAALRSRIELAPKVESCSCPPPASSDGESGSSQRTRRQRREPERISREGFCRNAFIKVCKESVHEESHGIGPAPMMCRTPAASVKASRRIPAFPHNGQHVRPQGGSTMLCG